MFRKEVWAGLALTATLAVAGMANAAVCTNAGLNGADISNRVDASNATTNSGCQVGNATTPHSPDPQTRANQDQLFGVTNWILISNPFQSPNSTSGSYNLANAVANFFTIYDKALLMFQSENPSDSVPINYVAYLLTAANGTTGSWVSPFFDEEFWEGKNKVAHIKLLGQLKAPPGPGPSPVPLPAPFLLLAAAVGGLGAMRWWKSRSAQAA